MTDSENTPQDKLEEKSDDDFMEQMRKRYPSFLREDRFSSSRKQSSETNNDTGDRVKEYPSPAESFEDNSFFARYKKEQQEREKQEKDKKEQLQENARKLHHNITRTQAELDATRKKRDRSRDFDMDR